LHDDPRWYISKRWSNLDGLYGFFWIRSLLFLFINFSNIAPMLVDYDFALAYLDLRIVREQTLDQLLVLSRLLGIDDVSLRGMPIDLFLGCGRGMLLLWF